eukprot:TRINITY_DN20493_c0_g1_i1.p1 TRINITY_DN20493_c0_g1~~TRINITY_DN20493_c0_g1_i1.p1  ORF type:complete len:209 (+),score=41.46 TRINITY_DN20493_c0_g1_i1:102-728(+)
MWRPPALWSTAPSPDPGPSALGRAGSGSRTERWPTATASTSSSAGPFPLLHDLSVEELKAVLTDQKAYQNFFFTIERVASADALRTELQKSNLEQAERSLTRESEIAELRNQCMIIRTTELAAAQERFAELRKEELRVHGNCSTSSLIEQLKKAADEVDEQSEELQRQFVQEDMDMLEFINQYKKLRVLYHTRTLTRQAAQAWYPASS